MRKIGWGVCLLVFLASCGNKKTKIDPFVTITNMVDSATHKADTVTEIMPETGPLPIEADESFDDFIYNFASDGALQVQRTRFPLPFHNVDNDEKIKKEEWKHDYLFTQQSYYTLMFDNEDELDLVRDTALSAVEVECVLLKNRMLKKYYFEREKGAWMLEAIRLNRIEKSGKEDFVTFYSRFVTDSVYQSRHICKPLQYITIDPDDEFAILETTLDLNQWYAFRPILPAECLSNINYGQQNNDNSNTKILKVNGIGNGYSNIFYFRRRGGTWELFKFEDTSI